MNPTMVYLSGVMAKRDTTSMEPLKVISDSPEPVIEADSDESSESLMMEIDEPIKSPIVPLRES